MLFVLLNSKIDCQLICILHSSDNFIQLSGDTVSIYLDLIKKELKYFINDIDQGIAFNDIPNDKNINYRLAISIYSKGDIVEIINFTKKYK